ncbi:MAG: hypothetical protein ACXQTW_03280, partial [Candidatus Methanospirareceae archaeon]
ACGDFDNQRPHFYGKEVRGVRRHFAWLRKRLGEKKLLKEIKRIGQKERRIVDSYLHEISREIVKRLSQARFKCDNCGLDYFNADVNGVRNLLKRELSYIGSSGASVNMPITEPFLMSSEATCFNGW